MFRSESVDSLKIMKIHQLRFVETTHVLSDDVTNYINLIPGRDGHLWRLMTPAERGVESCTMPE